MSQDHINYLGYYSSIHPTTMWIPLRLVSLESWIFILSTTVLAWYYVYRKWQYLRQLNIPHDPPSLFRLGHMLDLFGKKRAFSYDNEMKKKYGPIWGSYTLFSPGISIHDPGILRQILIKEFRSFPVRRKTLTKINGKELNKALSSVEGNQWKRIRSSLTPTFSTAKLRQMTYIMDRCADNAVAALDRKILNDAGIFDPKTLFSRLSLDIVCSAAFSTEVNSQDDSVSEPEISRQVKKLFKGSFFKPIILLCYLYPPFEKVLAYFNYSVFPRESIEFFKALTQHVIRQRELDPAPEKRRVDLLQQMLKGEISEKDAKSESMAKGMDRAEIIGNSMQMLIGGYENTGNSLSFLTYNLAQYPDIQRQLQGEIDEVIAKKKKIDYDSVGELKYLDMCINETLRLYNPVLRNARICEKETTINGLTIPRGISVNIPVYALSHDPEFWDEPMAFRPERMSHMSRIDPMVYQPFGAGPRNCIGLRFALVEMKIAMAKLLHQFNFEPAGDTPKPPLQLAFGVSVRPLVDYDLKVFRRHRTE